MTQLFIYRNISKEVDDFKIVYTSLYCTELVPINRVLSMFGYKEMHVVGFQRKPDRKFSTVESPNPEEIEALTERIDLAEEIGADIVLGTDLDSD